MKISICKHCGTEFNQPPRYSTQFCSKHCSAVYNNLHRKPRTEESKAKVSATIKRLIAAGEIKIPTNKGNHISNSPYTKLFGLHLCNSCNKEFWQLTYNQKCCSVSCRDNIRSQNKCMKTQIEYFNKHENKPIILQSKWELSIAEWLDKHNIIWTRPSSRIKWFDTTLQKHRTYLPDFLLVNYNYFLDVKNPIKMEQDKDKLSQLVSLIPLEVGDILHIQNFVARLTGLEPACIH